MTTINSILFPSQQFIGLMFFHEKNTSRVIIDSWKHCDYKPLHNGNISAMTVNIGKLNAPMLYNYQYDQLNRIVAMDAFTGLNQQDNIWNALSTDSSFKERISYDGNGNIQTYIRNGALSGSTPLPMDNLSYQYNRDANGRLINNKLSSVTDLVPAANYPNDIDNQSNNNYGYDAIGNLVRDNAEGIATINWTVYGKISSISKTDGSMINYHYDAAGNRISKTVTPPSGIGAVTNWYVRDASGNVMAIYSAKGSDSLYQTERHLYGSSRLGIFNRKVNNDAPLPTGTNANLIGKYVVSNFTRGNKNYELSNHLGNVLVTVSDKKTGHSTDSTTVDYYEADVVTAQDYYPFGMGMPGRQYLQDTITEIVGGGTGSQIPMDTTVIELYKHSFSDTPSTHPYLTIPNVINASLNNSAWTNSRSSWTSYSSNTVLGRTIAMDNSLADTANILLSLDIATGKKVGIKSFSFYHRVSNSGYRKWKMYINGIEVGDSTLYYPATGGTGNNTVQSTGTRLVSNKVENLSGHLSVLIKLYDHDGAYPTGNVQGTFRMDDFILNGYVNDEGSSSGGSGQYVNKGGYRYGFNGQEKSIEINGSGNLYTAEFWEYDSRIGRRWNLDPVVKEWESPYATFSNNAIWHIDFKGNTDTIPSSLATKRYDASSWWSPLTKLIPNAGAVDHSHTDDINNIYQKSGGDATFNSNSGTISKMNSSLQPIQAGSIIQPTGSNAITNLNNAYYSSSESGSQGTWINLLLGGTIKGSIPENIVFSVNGTVSNFLRGSATLNRAVRDWYKNGQSSAPFGVIYSGSEQLNDVGNNFTFFTMGNFVGSAMAQITYSTKEDILRVTITNVTSVHSGDYMKHMYWHNEESPFLLRNPNNTKPQPYTNSSQTYQLKFSYKSILQQIGNEYKLIE